MQTIEQSRAAYALQCVEEVNCAKKEVAQEYKSYARQWGPMVHANGLGQALAFAKSKPKSEAWKMLYRHLSNWLTGNAIAQNVACPAPLRVDAKTIDAVVAITTQPAEAYLAATAEALALVLWIKRLAEASIVDTPPPEQAPEISPTV